jgi:hypothetical protein
MNASEPICLSLLMDGSIAAGTPLGPARVKVKKAPRGFLAKAA